MSTSQPRPPAPPSPVTVPHPLPHPHPLPRRSLQTRLALAYAAGIYLAGIVVLVIVDVPLASVQSTKPKGRPGPATLTDTGHGIGLGRLLAGSAVALAVLVPVALALGWYIAGRFLRPLRAITATAKHISAGDLHQRLGLGAPADELTELGSTLDDLFARLQNAFDAQRHFVANASHELRTPLAGLRTLLEVALADPDADAEALRAVCQEALVLGEHQERLVSALLMLATGERGITHWETCDLARITGTVVDSRRDQAADKGLALAERLEPAVTSGDPRLIESLVANLVDNAIRHNHPHGRVRISTEISGPWAAITVTNDGPVVPEDQVQRLLQPFQRLSSSRNERRGDHGLGLGLAIINAVVQAHHAFLNITARLEGGLVVTVRFTTMGSKESESESSDAELVMELEEDETSLPGTETSLPGADPNFRVGDGETIGGTDLRRSWAGRFPRGVRVAAALAAVVALTVFAWPTPKTHQPTPKPPPNNMAMNPDLYKVREAGTMLDADHSADHAELVLRLVSSAASPLNIVNADVVDATGARLGTTSTWPPGTIAANDSVSVPMTLPFTCMPSVAVMPISIRYSVSSPQDPNTRHEYVSPLANGNCAVFTRERAAHCSPGTNTIYATSVDTTQSPGGGGAKPGFDLTFSFQTVGTASWSVDGFTTDSPDIQVSTTNTPLALAPGQTGAVKIHVGFASCTSPHAWVADGEALRFNARMTGPGGNGDQPYMKWMQSGLLGSMVQKACQA